MPVSIELAQDMKAYRSPFFNAPLTTEELERIEKAQKEREANKVGKNDGCATRVEK